MLNVTQPSGSAYTGTFINTRNPSSSPPHGLNIGFDYQPNNGTSEFLKCL